MSKLETNTIDTISGSTNLTLGGTNATDITIPAGVTITNNGTQSGFGGVMTPAFTARRNGDQTFSNNTDTKVQFDTEVFDTNNCYDNATNYRFTPTTSGKYYIFGYCMLDSNGANNFNYGKSYIYKNGSKLTETIIETAGDGRSNTLYTSVIDSANGSTDYYEFYVLCNTISAGSPTIAGGGGTIRNIFGAYKIIE